ARRREDVWTVPGGVGVRAFDHPISAAMVLTLLASVWIYTRPLPRGFVALAQVLALAPAIRVMRPLLDPSLRPWLYVLGAFFLADLVRHFASAVPLLERQIFLLQMFAGAAVLAWWLTARRPRSVPAGPALTARDRALRFAAGAVFIAFRGCPRCRR